MTELVAAIDQGTQSTRVYLFDYNLQPVASHQITFPQIYPCPGWVEHDPYEIWLTVQECMVKALQDATTKLGKVQVQALGITNQRETTVVWHKATGQPLHNAIVWLDTRTGDLCTRMTEELGSRDYFRPVTGLPISTYFSGFKFKWLYENVEEVRKAVDADQACFGTIDSWLIYQLTGGAGQGVHVTDVSNASRTMLMALDTCDWHEPYFAIFNMRPSALPQIASNAEVYGKVEARLAGYMGVPISGCLGDQMAAVLGQRCKAGEAKNTYGTGCFMLLNTGPQAIASKHGLLTTISYKLGKDKPTQYALEGAVAVAGMGLSWLRDNLGIIESPQDAEQLAATVPDTGGVYFVPAFSGLLAPHWDNTARGVILGLTGFSTRAHVVRAMLEAICWQAREVLDAMRADIESQSTSGVLGQDHGLAVLRVDGGAARNNLLMQLQADLLQVEVVRPHFQETTVLGACIAAGLGAGLWGEDRMFAGHAYSNTEFRPSIQLAEAEKRYQRWKLAVERSLKLAHLST